MKDINAFKFAETVKKKGKKQMPKVNSHTGTELIVYVTQSVD